LAGECTNKQHSRAATLFNLELFGQSVAAIGIAPYNVFPIALKTNLNVTTLVPRESVFEGICQKLKN
jgi:hypothetical protein